MQKSRLSIYASLVSLLLCLSAGAEEHEPTLETPAGMKQRREDIHKELDRNVEAVKGCFELLDSTPKSDTESCQFLDAQIQQYDDRSNVLHEELEEIEKQEFLVLRESEMLREMQRLQSEAQQLKSHGHIVQAELRRAKAAAMQKKLDDGTWRMLAADEWSCDSTGMDLVSVLQLNAEVESLKLETNALRAEVKQLREVIQQLERQVNGAGHAAPE